MHAVYSTSVKILGIDVKTSAINDRRNWKWVPGEGEHGGTERDSVVCGGRRGSYRSLRKRRAEHLADLDHEQLGMIGVLHPEAATHRCEQDDER